MDKTELCFTPATELAGAIRAKKLSAVEITSTVLDRIATLEPKLNAFAHLAADEAMDAAAKADRALAGAGPGGPLHGIPVTIKDHEAVRGMPVEYGTHLRRGDVASADNAMVSRLRKAGAIILGKTTTPEFGWTGVSHSPLTGITHNPWKLGLNAGASSAGAGAGAAAGYGPLHQGSDGAGSIRMPAHFCGVYGLKPTYGRVPHIADRPQRLHRASRPVDAHRCRRSADAQGDGRPASRRSNEPGGARRPIIPACWRTGRARRASPSARTSAMPASIPRSQLWCARPRRFSSRVRRRVEQVRPRGARGPELVRFFWPAHFTRLAAASPNFATRMDPGFVACIRRAPISRWPTISRCGEWSLAYVAAIHVVRGLGFPADAPVSVAAFPAELLQARRIGRGIPGTGSAGPSSPTRSTGPAARPPACPAASPRRACRSACRSSGGATTISACCRCRAAFEAARPWASLRPPNCLRGSCIE